MSLSDLANDLHIHVNALGNAVIDSFRRDEDATKKLLEKYHVDVLYEVKHLVTIQYDKIYEIIMKRRMAYVERERAKYKKRIEQGIQPSDQSKWIDFSRDPDDTQNLTCGMGVLSKYINIIDAIIVSKANIRSKNDEDNIDTCQIM
jgi:hypothetical protein